MIKQVIEGDGWTRLNCGFCDGEDGYYLYLHKDYGNTIVSVCKGCGKIYFCGIPENSKADIGAA